MVVHDCNPASAAAAAPSLDQARRTDGFNWEWNGDVYRRSSASGPRRPSRRRARLRPGRRDRHARLPGGTLELSLDRSGASSTGSSRGTASAPRAATAGRASAAARPAARLTHHGAGAERGRNHRRATARADPSGGVRARRRRRGARPGPRSRSSPTCAGSTRSPRSSGRARAPRLDVQLTRPRRPPSLGGAERRRGRLRLARPRRVLLVQGHDVPGLYAALNALGVIPTERLLSLRRLGGSTAIRTSACRESRRTRGRSGWASPRLAGSPGPSGIWAGAGVSS